MRFKREKFGRDYIWGTSKREAHQEFDGWTSFLAYEKARRSHNQADITSQEPAIDTACVCTLDTQHVEIILALAPLGLHILSEKPLATTLQDCLAICRSLKPAGLDSPPTQVFGVGHVLRYSPHNMLLRKLLLQDRAVGDILSVEHTEPVGWWHFSHSYVRGHWRREDTTAPSLLTKSCHDIDLLLWLLCSSFDPENQDKPHLPVSVSSVGQLGYFKKSRKPAAAGSATNCLQCPIKDECRYSAKNIYIDKRLKNEHVKNAAGWPFNVVEPEIEELDLSQNGGVADGKLLRRLEEDYDSSASDEEIKARPWFGRCVWESDNDVCDDQIVNIVWEDEEVPRGSQQPPRLAKTATFHQIAHTEAQCARRGRVYGSHGELTYDSKTIRVFDFGTSTAKEYQPSQLDFNDPLAKHGGGDTGLAQQFVGAVAAVLNDELSVDQAQKRFLGCTVEDVLRSHAMVFAAEEARTSKTILDWPRWWRDNVENGSEDGSTANGNAIGGWEVVS